MPNDSLDILLENSDSASDTVRTVPAVIQSNAGGNSDADSVLPPGSNCAAGKLSKEELEAGNQYLKKQKEESERIRVEAELRKIKYPSQYRFPILLSLQKYANWGFVFISAVLVLLILSQAIQYYAVVAALPLCAQCIFITCFTVCVAVILWTCFKIGRFLFRLKIKPEIDVRIIKILNDRTDLQQAARKAEREAVEKLKSYLEEYKLDESDKQFFIQEMGMSENNYCNMEKAKKEFFNENVLKKQIQLFQDDFQKPLDELAKQRVSGYYYKVLTGTALSPRAMVDQLIIVAACISMICDLLRIYRVKPAAGQSLFLLAHAFFNIYIGGRIQNDVANAVDTVSNATNTAVEHMKKSEEITKIFGANIFDAIPFLGTILKPFTAKIAEGTINALLIQKLGKEIIKQLQPTERQ